MTTLTTTLLLFHLAKLPSFHTQSIPEPESDFPQTCLTGALEQLFSTGKCDPERMVDFSESSSQPLPPELQALSGHQTSRVYPPRLHPPKSLKRYAELPYPIPVGPSLYFVSFFLVLLSFYIRKALARSLIRTAEHIELYPDINQFPQISLYSLQQSKREARLRRESRNIWAWLARKYLLKQKDPRVNVEVFKTTWSDFDLPKDVWGLVRAVRRVNAWVGKAHKDYEERKARSEREKKERVEKEVMEGKKAAAGNWLRSKPKAIEKILSATSNIKKSRAKLDEPQAAENEEKPSTSTHPTKPLSNSKWHTAEDKHKERRQTTLAKWDVKAVKDLHMKGVDDKTLDKHKPDHPHEDHKHHVQVPAKKPPEMVTPQEKPPVPPPQSEFDLVPMVDENVGVGPSIMNSQVQKEPFRDKRKDS